MLRHSAVFPDNHRPRGEGAWRRVPSLSGWVRPTDQRIGDHAKLIGKSHERWDIKDDLDLIPAAVVEHVDHAERSAIVILPHREFEAGGGNAQSGQIGFLSLVPDSTSVAEAGVPEHGVAGAPIGNAGGSADAVEGGEGDHAGL